MDKINLSSFTNVSIQFNNGRPSVSVLADPEQAVKEVLHAYHIYFRADESANHRVIVTKGDHPSLVLQEDIALHGSPCWKDVMVLTEDPETIEAYKAAKTVLQYMKKHG